MKNQYLPKRRKQEAESKSPSRERQIINLQMLDRENEESSRRLRLSEKDPHGDETLGLMPPTDLDMQTSSQRLLVLSGKAASLIPPYSKGSNAAARQRDDPPWKDGHQQSDIDGDDSDDEDKKEDSIQLITIINGGREDQNEPQKE